MKAQIKLYVKQFLAFAFLYGAISLVFAFFDIEHLNIGSLVIKSLVIGILFSLVVVSIHISNLIELGVKEMTDKTLSVHQTALISKDISKDALLNILKEDPITASYKIQQKLNSIVLSTGLSISSWGETIEVHWHDVKAGVSQISISSKPRFALTTLDYGKNIKNVNLIKNLAMKTYV